MIGILIPLLLMTTPVKAEADPQVNAIYGPELESSNSILDWKPEDMHKLFDALREHHRAKNRSSVDDMLNKALLEYQDGSDGSTEQKELLQLSSGDDRQGT